jgi:hypothetical protein
VYTAKKSRTCDDVFPLCNEKNTSTRLGKKQMQSTATEKSHSWTKKKSEMEKEKKKIVMKKIWARDLLSFFLMILCFNSLECKKGKK